LAELKFLGYLAEVVGTRTKHLVLNKPTPLRRILPSSFPEENVIILIDERVGNLDSVIENESSVILMVIGRVKFHWISSCSNDPKVLAYCGARSDRIFGMRADQFNIIKANVLIFNAVFFSRFEVTL
jgi:hypothetical protein